MINFNEQIFKNHSDTLKNTSYDSSNKVHMTNLTNACVNFDDVKAEYLSNNGRHTNKLTSCDALFSHTNGHVLIEFKNGNFNSSEIKNKLYDSLLIISDIKNLNIVNIFKNEMEFILVYNATACAGKISSSLRSIHGHMGAIAGTEIVHFDLFRYKGVYFKDVHTYTVSEFEKYINSL